MAEKRKGLSIEQCVERAERILEVSSLCLFQIDLVDSRMDVMGYEHARMQGFIGSVNATFAARLPVYSIARYGVAEQGMAGLVRGDEAYVGVDSPNLIVDIVDFKEIEYPELKLHYGVAVDGWDKDGFSLRNEILESDLVGYVVSSRPLYAETYTS